jgi:hypothetical protein
VSCIRVVSAPTVLASHSLHVLSNDPVMILSPYGLLKAMAYTTFLCPSSVWISSPVLVFHTLHVRS